MRRAVCPVCHRETNCHGIDGRMVYVAHRMTRNDRTGKRCEASDWLVEDDELVTIPRRPYPLKDIAQPARSVCRRCVGEGLHEGDLCRCCNGTGSRPPVPKKENESNG